MPSDSPSAAHSRESCRLDPAIDRDVVRRRAEVLADGDDVDADGREVGEQPVDLGVGLAEADHEPGLGHEAGGLGPGEHRQAAGVAGRRAHGPLQPGDRLDVVVEHIGADREQRRPGRRRCRGRRRSTSRLAPADAAGGSPRRTRRRGPSHRRRGRHGRPSSARRDRGPSGRSPRPPAPARRPPAPPACACRRGRSRTPWCTGRRGP